MIPFQNINNILVLLDTSMQINNGVFILQVSKIIIGLV